MISDDSLLKVTDEQYTDAINLWQQFFYEADIDNRMFVGDQSFYNNLMATQPFRLQNQLYFNQIRRIVNMIVGHQRKNRKTSICVPQEASDQDTADQMSGLLMWSLNNCNGYNTISEAFQGATVTGLNLLAVWMDWRSDPVSGDIRVERYPFNAFMLDPYFNKPDLSDCNWIRTRKWLSKNEVKSLLPQYAKDVDQMQYEGARDGKFAFMPENFQYSQRKLLSYDEYWYRDFRDVKVIVDPDTGESMEWKGDDDLFELYREMHPNIEVLTYSKQTVRLAIIVNGKVLYNGENPLGLDRYPFVPVFGYFCPEMQYFNFKMQGIVRGLRDAQFAYNRRKRLELDILEAQIGSGIQAKEDALVNPEDAFLTGPGRVRWIKKTSQMSDVQEIPPPNIPPGMLQVSEILKKEILDISGVTEELLGAADGDKVGIVEMLRQGAGLVTLQTLFDNLDLAQKFLSSLFIELIQEHFTEGKVRRILNQEPTLEFRNRLFGKYDCQIVDGALTATQKQMQFMQLLQLKQLEVPVPTNLLVEASTLQNKRQLIEAIEQETQAAQQQQQMQFQMQMQKEQIIANSLQAKAYSDKALGEERLAKIVLEKALNAERIARAQEDLDAATLDRIKAIKELQTMDVDNLHKFVNMIKMLQEGQEDQAADRSAAGAA